MEFLSSILTSQTSFPGETVPVSRIFFFSLATTAGEFHREMTSDKSVERVQKFFLILMSSFVALQAVWFSCQRESYPVQSEHHFTCHSENLVYSISWRRCPVFTLVRLEETSGVASANICEEYATTLLGFLWSNISIPLATVFLMSRCVAWCGIMQWY